MKKTSRIRGKPFRILLLSLLLSLSIPAFAFAATNSTENSLIGSKDYLKIVEGTGVNLLVFDDVYSSLGIKAYKTSTEIRFSNTINYTYYYSADGGTTYNAGNHLSNTGNIGFSSIDSGTVDVYTDTSYTTKYFAGVVSDTTAPVDVTNVTASNITDTGLTLNWSASVSNDVTAYQVYKGLELLGSTAGTTYNVTGLTPSTAYDFIIKAVDGSNNVANGVTVHYSTNQVQGGDPPVEPAVLFPSLIATGITSQATAWSNNFGALLLVIVGVGLGFAAVRFVKGLFF